MFISEIMIPLSLRAIIDNKRESLFLPICGILTPFHISTIKQISMIKTLTFKEIVILRVLFKTPSYQSENKLIPSTKPLISMSIKELCFISKDISRIRMIIDETKNLQKKLLGKNVEELVGDPIKQILLQKGIDNTILRDVWIRPILGCRNKKLPGSLEVFSNGMRYTTPASSETIEITFDNIKHAFIQTAEKEIITLIHFHLHNNIKINKKPTQDVQFYSEVMEAAQSTEAVIRHCNDPDELLGEEREKLMREKINKDFLEFTEKVQKELWQKNRIIDKYGTPLEWDTPHKKLAFHGVPHKSMSLLIPTNKCLVELIETPFTVITLDEVEVINLERAALHLKNFDLAIVNKDFTKDVMRIEAIPIKNLEMIKEWLKCLNIKHYESKANLNWKQVIKVILDDPLQFQREGGWDFLNLDATDSGDEAGDCSEFEPDSEECEETDDDSYECSLEESCEKLDKITDVDDDNPSWDELERQAEREDMMKIRDHNQVKRTEEFYTIEKTFVKRSKKIIKINSG
jgi:nucleosome binding factor SPN SPT16 subunit